MSVVLHVPLSFDPLHHGETSGGCDDRHSALALGLDASAPLGLVLDDTSVWNTGESVTQT